MKWLHDWNKFDLPKFMPVERISFLPASCLSPTNPRQDQHANKLLITAQPIRNLLTPASAEMNKQEAAYSGFSLACLKIRSRNEEAINCTRNETDLLAKCFLLSTLSTSILFNSKASIPEK